MAGESAYDQCSKEGCRGCKNCSDDDFHSHYISEKTINTKYKVLIDDQVKEYKTLEEAIEIIKQISSKLTVSAMIAATAGNDELREKCNKTRNSIKMEIING